MFRIAKFSFFAFVLNILFSAGGQAATINAASCSFTDVSNAVAAAVDGDTVVLPACPQGVSYTSNLRVEKGITIQGQGIGQTVIIDDVPKGGAGCGGGNSASTITAVFSPRMFRLTGLTIRGSAPDVNTCQAGHLRIGGSSKAFRVDHVRFENMQTVGIRTFNDMWGVIDHCEFQGSAKNAVVVAHDSWNGTSFGDGSWAAPSNLGTQEFIFIEDNDFTELVNQNGVGGFDAFDGARFVIRFNRGLNQIVTHGTESSGRRRGVRAYEIYGNIFVAERPFEFTAISLRGGTGVIYNNEFNDSGSNTYNSIALVQNMRDRDTFSPWGVCAGLASFDLNDGVVYVTGTHNGPDGVFGTLTDTSKDFTRACAGGSCGAGEFSILNRTRGWGSIIENITPTSVTNQSSTRGQSRIWHIGDTYEIRKVHPCIDQIGRGEGDMISGSTPTPARWPNQVSDPLYQWNNTRNGIGSPVIASNSRHVRANRDFFDNAVKPGYTPFPYPHPLTLTTGGAPAAPTNLRKVAP